MVYSVGVYLVFALGIPHESLFSSLSRTRVSLLAYRCVLVALGGILVLAQTKDRQGSCRLLYLGTLRYAQSQVVPSR